MIDKLSKGSENSIIF